MTFVALLLGWIALINTADAEQYHWDGAAATPPHEMSPPWKLVSSGSVAAYIASDRDRNSTYLISTQAEHNVYFEQSGTNLQIIRPLVLQANLRVTSGSTTVPNRGVAGITFTVAENLGGSLWINRSNLFVTAEGDTPGASTNLDTTTAYHSYRIVLNDLTNGSPYTVYYDNSAVLLGTLFHSPSTFGSQPRIQWGDIAETAYGESHWSSFNHNAAAPFTTLTNPAVELACVSTSSPALPEVSAPYMSLVSEGRITDGSSAKYANFSLVFNTDNGVIYQVVQGGYAVLDSQPRRVFTQSDGSQITLFEFTDLSFRGISVSVTGSRAAAILATGDIQLQNATLQIDAAGDPGARAGSELSAGLDAVAPLGGGGGRGVASAYSAGSPPFLVPGKLPTSGPGGGGFVSMGQDGFPAEPVAMWKYNGAPNYDFTVLGRLYRPGGEGGATYTDFSVLRGGGGGGSSSGTGFAGNSGSPGGHGGGALFLSTPGHIHIDSKSTISVDGQTMVSFLSEIAAGGAGGYLVLQGDQGILNQGLISARGGIGRKYYHRNQDSTIVPWWGSCGNGSGGLILLKSQSGVTNAGAVFYNGSSSEKCTAGAIQIQTPSFIQSPMQLSLPVLSKQQISISLPTVINAPYRVQYNDDLNTSDWVTFTNLTGTGLPAKIVYPVPGTTNRFFRAIAD